MSQGQPDPAPTDPAPFDPDAPLVPGDTIFGLPTARADARVVVIPAPFDATASYGTGSVHAPDRVRAASVQLDLLDRRFGPIHERGIFMHPTPAHLIELSAETRRLAQPIIDRGGATPADAQAVARIDAAGEAVNAHVYVSAKQALDAGQVPATLGGEHSVSYGAIKAVCEAHPGVGVLQIDAHMDLRPAYEGFRWSHASVMHNVLTNLPELGRLVQLGVRDYCRQEADLAERHDAVRVHFWDDLASRLADGNSWTSVCERVIADLPETIYISLDIDGLDPSLAPNTGTPVPGGPSFDQFSVLLSRLAESGKRVVGFDVVEVSPSQIEGAPPIDESVGARCLYRLCGLA